MLSPTPPLSRIHRTVLVVGIVCLLTTFVSIIFVAARNDNSQTDIAGPTLDRSTRARIAERFGRLPLSFEVNKGQVDTRVKFLSHGPGYVLFLTPAEAVLTLHKPHTPAIDKLKRPDQPAALGPEVIEGSVLRLKMIGVNADPRVEGQDELVGKVNYFTGNSPDKWRRNIPTYRKVHYSEVYPGIEMVYYGNQGELEYDFVVAPGANPKLIKFRVEGAERIRLDESGNLRFDLHHGEVQLNKPLIYQLTAEGNRRDVKGEYVVKGNEISFKVRAFDAKKPLVIDPILSYSTFLGAGNNEHALGIAVDSQGNAYVTGVTNSSLFPTTAGAFKPTNEFGSNIAFVTKLDATGSNLVYSTFLGGTTFGISTGSAIAVDSSGNAHVSGSTSQTDFPIVNGLKTSANFFKSTDSAANWSNNNTGLAGDVNKIAVAPNSPNIIYAGSIGPYRSADGGATWTKTPTTGLPAFAIAISMAVDPGNAQVVYAGMLNGGLFKTTDSGNTWSAVTTIPLNSNVVAAIVFDSTTPSTMYVGSSGGVFKSTDSGATWTALNNFGLVFPPNVRALAIDPTTPSTIYAGTGGSGFFKTTNGGANWTAMNSGMGGTEPTFISAIVIDPFNPSTIYAGHGFPGSGGSVNKSTNGATSWTPVNNGMPNFEIREMVADRANASTVYAATTGGGVIKTTNGGTSWTTANAGLWGTIVRTLVAHPTNSSIFYAGTNTDQIAQDAFVTKLNSSGSGLLFSTYLGGSQSDFGNGIALDSSGNIAVVGQTTSKNFPVANAVQSQLSPTDTCGGAFVSKINPAVPSYVFSTYLDGTKCETANGVATDPSGNIYVTGNTSSSDFPLANAFQATLGESFIGDAFVTRLTNTGALSYSTFLGGNNSDTGHAIAADLSGNAYVTGTTTSTNFPTASPIQPTNGGFAGDAFVTKLNPQGSALVYSTFLGGSGTDVGRGIAVDSTGSAYVTGFTTSQEFPLVPGALRTKSVMFKSVDGAATWSNDNYGLAASSISAIAVHPTQPSTIFAGTTVGVFRSTNGGRTWLPINNGLNSKNVVAIVIDRKTPSTIYVAANDLGNPNNGIYKSFDGGATWLLRRTGLINTNVQSLAIDPVTTTTLYVGTFGSVIFKSTDGAENWEPTGVTSPTAVFSISVDPNTPTTIFAAEQFSNGGIFRSTDTGKTWGKVGFDQTGAHASFVGVSPLTPNLVYAVAQQGLVKSTDGGNTWSVVRPGSGRLVFDPVNASTLYFLAFQQGVLKSTDSGQTWVPMNEGLPTPSAVALAIDPLNPSTLHLSSSSTFDEDAFITRINPAGSALIYSTLLGGFPAAADSFNVNDEGLAITIDSGGNAYVTGIARSPNFPTTPNAFQPSNRGFSDAFISKLAMSHIISGHVLEGGTTPLSGAEVVLNDGGTLTTIFTESDGSYAFSRLRQGGSFTVIATKPHFTMTPPSQSISNLNSDQVLNFTATATNSPFFTISGQVTDNGVGLAGVTVTLSGSQPGTRTTDSNGNYSFELAGGGNYTVTPALTGFTFGPLNQTLNNLGANQTANFTSTRLTTVVTNTNNHGAGSLRDAILNANATVGLDTIAFNIPGAGVKVINPLTALPEITDPVVIDGTTQPGYAGSPIIVLDGIGLSDAAGLFISAGGSTVRGLAIGRFFNAGIILRECDNNVVQGNYIGLNATGSALPNNSGIVLSASSNNLIGGTTAAARNVISGNQFHGLSIVGNDNVVQGNFIGTNPAGTAAIPNGINGVEISSAPATNNLIGGTAAGAGNLISGNQRGILINPAGNTVQGNLIGTDVTGTKKVPNLTGIESRGPNTLIGGLAPGARNVISGNDVDGVAFGGTGSKLQGNFIGTDITGTLALGNGASGVVAGDNALIGGTVPEARNVISGNAVNSGIGNVSIGSNNSGSGATVQGNYIGTDVTGTRAIADSLSGILISSVENLIGGLVPGAGNVISGNIIGIRVGVGFQNGVAGNTIHGNLIGLNAQGTAPLPNRLHGIEVAASDENTIGGTQNGAANKIAFNGLTGVVITQGTGNSIRGNSIFSNAGLGIDLGGFASGTAGVTPNDPNDADNGSNNLQNFPVLTSVTSVGSNTTIQGSLNSTPNTTFQIDFYTSAALDSSGNGEGAQFFNTTSVTTDANGNATINASFPVALGTGRVVTATATDPSGNTSEFSAGDATGASGQVQFSVRFMSVIEDVGLMTVTVVRTGGSAGTLTVDFATSDDTAIAGQDYTATSGTLTFNGGETSKTFQIPITDDVPTEPNETFTVSLRNTSNLESLGIPYTLGVTVLDRSIVPTFLIGNATVVEGGPGTTTLMSVPLNLSAATGRTASVSFATSNSLAVGGTSCNTRGVDYITTSGTITFSPGTTALSIPITICGDSIAETGEAFLVTLSNAVNGQFFTSIAVGGITNDDVLELVLEESGPVANQAAALDALFLLRDPFRIVGIPEWWPTTTDRNTRVILFARNLELNPGESPSAVIVSISGFEIPAEDVRPIHNFEFTEVVFRLPNTLPLGTQTVTIRARGQISNSGTIRIVQ